MKEQTVWLMIGILGSGKSTWSKMKAESDCDGTTSIVSEDSIREMLYGSYRWNEGMETLVSSIAHAAMIEVLNMGHNLVIDECHITKNSRARVVNRIKRQFCVRTVGVWCPGKIDNVYRRMQSPKGQSKAIWQRVYTDMVANFQNPTEDEFDKLIIVNKELE
jgi:predicted kinase